MKTTFVWLREPHPMKPDLNAIEQAASTLLRNIIPGAVVLQCPSLRMEHNRRWLEETRPILEAFFHARTMLTLVVRYGTELEEAPRMLPSGGCDGGPPEGRDCAGTAILMG